MIIKRIVTAAIGIPILIASIIWGGETLFFIIVLIFAASGVNEFFRVALPEHAVEKILGITLSLGILVCVFWEQKMTAGNISRAPLLPLAGCAISLFVPFFYNIVNAREMADAVTRMAISIFGIFYISIFLSYLIPLRSAPYGISLVLFLLIVTWAGDAGSYIIGSWIGKRRLCPTISPKKTVEGAVGGFVCGVAAAFFCDLFLFEDPSPVRCFLLGAGINIMNQLGDLSESMIKRAFGIKNSGEVFPGHGGVLDRVDSLLFAAPFLFYCSAAFFPA